MRALGKRAAHYRRSRSAVNRVIPRRRVSRKFHTRRTRIVTCAGSLPTWPAIANFHAVFAKRNARFANRASIIFSNFASPSSPPGCGRFRGSQSASSAGARRGAAGTAGVPTGAYRRPRKTCFRSTRARRTNNSGSKTTCGFHRPPGLPARCSHARNDGVKNGFSRPCAEKSPLFPPSTQIAYLVVGPLVAS